MKTTFQVRVATDDLEAWTEAAAAEDISLGEWIRRAASAALGKCSGCGAPIKRRKKTR